MPESAKRTLERFQLVRVPSLPHLFLQIPFLKARESGRRQDSVDFLAQDQVLYLKVLATCGDRVDGQAARPAGVLAKIPPSDFENLVLNAALQSCFAEMSELQFEFHKRHWRQSQLQAFLLRELAAACGYPRLEEAAFCGQMLNCGELVLENVFSAHYLELQSRASNAAELLASEQEHFDSDHCLLGAALLRRWGVDSILCDAILYQHEALENVRDATRLVKLAWLATRLAEAENPAELAVLPEGARLLGLDEGGLLGCHARATQALVEQARRLGMQFGAGPRLPLDTKASGEVAAFDEVARLQFRHLVHCHSLFTTTRWGRDPAAMEASIGFNLSLLFGLRHYSLFMFDARKHSLSAVASQPRLEEFGELELGCVPEQDGKRAQSIVLRSYLDGERKTLAEDAERDGLPVGDRQLLSLYGKSRLCCEPLFADGRTVGVLVLGYDGAELNYYQDQSISAPLFRKAVSSLVLQYQAMARAAAPLPQQQRIREVIHEVNNPLGIIKNYLHLLGGRQDEDPALLEEIAVIKGEIDRIGNIVGKLRQGEASDVTGPVNPNAVVENLLLVYRASLFAENNIQVEVELDPRMPLLRSSEGMLKQIVSNLVLNAVEALGQGGRMALRTRARVFVQGESYAEIEVQDEGPGMPPAVLERLFTYANSTKGPGHSGDGLAIVKVLTQKLDGLVSCRSGPSGTAFSILLPLSNQEHD